MNKFAMFILGFLMTLPTAVLSQIPGKAFQYEKIIQYELRDHFPDLTYRHYVPALIEKESCISLSHSSTII